MPSATELPDVTGFSGITSDSRQVEKGFLFAAIPGVAQNGERYIPQAVENGAAGILCRRDWQGELPQGIRRIDAENPRQMLAKLAADYYRPMPRHIMAVTGTDGKTSTAEFCRQLLEGAGLKAATLGTLGLNSLHYSAPEGFPNTTPDPVVLHRHLQNLARAGVDYVAMEASSHGLHQYRLDGVIPEAGAFTTFGADHGDYHPTEQDYFDAKARLFREILPKGGRAVLNADDDRIAALARECAARGLDVIDFGRKAQRFHIEKLIPTADGISVDLTVMGSRWQGSLPLYGGFQVMNVLTAAGLAWPHLGGAEAFFAQLPGLSGVRGRLEKVAEFPHGMPVFVDYAHTAQALHGILQALRPHTAGHLIVVFGCGGDRDRAKRPEMGKVAAELADLAVVTDDNPRSEDPAAIRGEIMAACPGGVEIGDRGEAIQYALRCMHEGDVMVVAGKGHETTQLVGGKTLHFNDAEVIRENIMEIK